MDLSGGELPGVDDEDLDDQPELAPLDLIARRVNDTALQSDTVTWAVPFRPGFAATYSTEPLTHPERVKAWLTQARRKGKIDGDVYNCRVLTECCTGLAIDGQAVTEDGRALTFRDRALLDALGVPRAADAVRHWYGAADRRYGFAVGAHAAALMERAGSDDTPVEPDPT